MTFILLENGVEYKRKIQKDDIKEFKETPDEEKWRIGVIKELIAVRDGLTEPIGWTKQDVKDMLTHLCTT